MVLSHFGLACPVRYLDVYNPVEMSEDEADALHKVLRQTKPVVLSCSLLVSMVTTYGSFTNPGLKRLRLLEVHIDIVEKSDRRAMERMMVRACRARCISI